MSAPDSDPGHLLAERYEGLAAVEQWAEDIQNNPGRCGGHSRTDSSSHSWSPPARPMILWNTNRRCECSCSMTFWTPETVHGTIRPVRN